MGLIPAITFAEGDAVVLYPEVREPYLSVFHSIIDGVEADKRLNVRTYGLEKGFNSAEIKQWVASEQTDVVIALGRRGYLALKEINIQKPSIIGALRIAPNGISGVSQAAHPKALFNNLKSLAPQVSRVTVIYNQSNSEWLVELAKIAAQKANVELQAISANNLREAAVNYRKVLKSLNNQTDAIWLLSDKTTNDDKVILPMVLEIAWDKHLVVFSSNPSHAKRGALFSLYPDNYALGERLAEMAIHTLNSSQKQGVEPLKDLQVAVNLRTAAHLGLQFSQSQRKQFHLTFPVH